eukprot:IDg4326t1
MVGGGGGVVTLTASVAAGNAVALEDWGTRPALWLVWCRIGLMRVEGRRPYGLLNAIREGFEESRRRQCCPRAAALIECLGVWRGVSGGSLTRGGDR